MQVRKVSRKKFVKRLMGFGAGRNAANGMADFVVASNHSYREMLTGWRLHLMKRLMETVPDAHVVMHTNAFTPVVDIRPQTPACGVRDAPLTASALVTVAERKEE